MNNTEIMITLAEVELALLVANARWGLVNEYKTPGLDGDIVNQVWGELYDAGNHFNRALFGLMVANIVAHQSIDQLLYDIKALLYAFPQKLRDAFFVALD